MARFRLGGGLLGLALTARDARDEPCESGLLSRAVALDERNVPIDDVSAIHQEAAGVDIHIETDGIPVAYSTDPYTGEVTAYNHDLHVIAVADDQPSARERFFDALRFQIRTDLEYGDPLPEMLRGRVYDTA